MNIKTIFILSDGTGETASQILRAALVQFAHQEVHVVKFKNIRRQEQIDTILIDCFDQRGLIVHTLVNAEIRDQLQKKALEKGIPVVDLMGPLLTLMAQHFEIEHKQTEAGLLRTVDDRYFKRIEAIEFTVKNDDGKLPENLNKADIILVGISRTSKTPLSIFLSHKGWKVANVPLVFGQPIPEELKTVDQRKIVGLTIDPSSLIRIRRKRLEKFGQDPGGEYASLNHIQKEIDFANDLFKKNKRWPVFDVTDRALEETAAEIVRVVAGRMNLPFSDLL